MDNKYTVPHISHTSQARNAISLFQSCTFNMPQNAIHCFKIRVLIHAQSTARWVSLRDLCQIIIQNCRPYPNAIAVPEQRLGHFLPNSDGQKMSCKSLLAFLAPGHLEPRTNRVIRFNLSLSHSLALSSSYLSVSPAQVSCQLHS